MRCAFSLPPLRALIADPGFVVRAVVLPDAHGGHAIDRLARDAGIPVRAPARTRSAEMAHALAAFAPDVLVVACFPWKIPAAVRALAPLGGVNIHPSLLPELRGPEPVFWALRRGDRRTGVTLHGLDDGFDTGPILAQQAVEILPGVRAPDLEARLSEIGAALLGPTLRALATGGIAPRPQDHALGTAAPAPTEQDWLIPADLPATWAFGFARGVAPLGGPLAVLVMRTGQRLPVADALSVDPTATLDDPTRQEGATMVIRFRPGTAVFMLRP